MKDNSVPASAFPIKQWHSPEERSGMSLRDYFAAKAMQGFCAHPDQKNWTVAEMVADSYDYADAMLAEREKSART
jgi:hypothetical protein